MPRKAREPLKKYFDFDSEEIEIGIDEAGRGPMFGRVYAAAAVLPKTDDYNHELMKDSKRFTSEKKIKEAADYIKENAVAWGVGYSTEEEIDAYNIRKATHMAMHKAISQVMDKLGLNNDYHLLVDGNDFTIYSKLRNNSLITERHTCIKHGDDKYTPIAAASIIAKVERDDYISKLCEEDESLTEKYGIIRNKGYGTKEHMDGILEYGITKYHRKTFGICKNYQVK
uniref:Ribonuclease HII n=1 Tax=viral metagenome TaxID=1070528 RepID=A0A6C0CQX7_9ZZZZ